MGELARKPGCPELPETPLELLTLRPGEGYTKLNQFFWPVLGFVGGLGSAAMRNLLLRRPIWAGIHVYFLLAGGGCGIGIVARNSQFAARSETDAVLKHYITLHPDDFPPFERKRWKDVYVPFTPLR